MVNNLTFTITIQSPRVKPVSATVSHLQSQKSIDVNLCKLLKNKDLPPPPAKSAPLGLHPFLVKLVEKFWTWFSIWNARLKKMEIDTTLQRDKHRLLVFFHGYSLAHTIRPLVIARTLRQRGYEVVFAGRGPHSQRIAAEGFALYDVETMPQQRIDEYVSRGDYEYYDEEWIGRCVEAERTLVRQLQPSLLIGDLRPTLRLTAALEGIDIALIDAAYNQPGYPYPIRLPAYFPVQAGRFNDYLTQHLAQPQPYRHTFLLADVPEFHPPAGAVPPAYHYVGPLIEDEPSAEEPPAALADEGWDTSRPLVYFNCGSTGVDDRLLPAILQAFAHLPFRLLVTTAGRYAVEAPAANVRIVEYLPARLVMRRAALFIGIGGIGSIYHALAEGVPIIGAPEHLDQEYHLNRVRDLGLGLKLSRHHFAQAERLAKQVRYLFDHYDEFRTRCTAFADHIRAWQGGEAAAAVIDGLLYHNVSLEQDQLVSEDEFVRHLYPITTTASRPALRALLAEARQRGLPHMRQGRLVWYDKRTSWNWLYDHEPRFFELDYQLREQMRTPFLVHRHGQIEARRASQHYRLTYTYKAHVATCETTRPARLFLPYPLSQPQQPVVELINCDPSALRPYLVPYAGFFYAYPCSIDPADETLEFSYSCEVEVCSLPMAGRVPAPLTPSEHRHYTAVEDTLRRSRRVRDFLAELQLDAPGRRGVDKARRLYEGLAHSKRFKKTNEKCQCLACSTAIALSDGGGHCITLSRAYIALCRMLGIPAREATGGLAVAPQGPDRYGISTYDTPVFGHTWVELYLEETGWWPVEFHGIALGRHAMTEDNVADPVLRQRIERHSEAFLEYYFGHLDCHRVLCSKSVKDLPQLVLQNSDAKVAPHRQLISPEGLHYECHLTFECL